MTGHHASELRPYSRFLPGVREFNQSHQLAPETTLRFGLVTNSFPMKPLPLARARLESFLWTRWSQALLMTTATGHPSPRIPLKNSGTFCKRGANINKERIHPT